MPRSHALPPTVSPRSIYEYVAGFYIHVYNILYVFMHLFTDNYKVNADKSKSKYNTSPASAVITTPHQASGEFGILISNIIRELKLNEHENLEVIKNVCSYLTIKDDSSVLLFNEDQLKEIEACKCIRIMFIKNLRGCWRWDDFSLLKILIQSLESADRCEQMLTQYEQKLNSQMKLQEIYNYCMSEKQKVPKGYDKMVAIVSNKIFYRITKKEYDELKQFVGRYCGVKPFVIPPFCKAAVSSLLLEFIIPKTAVSYMAETATRNITEFIKKSFVYLKISSTVVLDARNDVSFLCSSL